MNESMNEPNIQEEHVQTPASKAYFEVSESHPNMLIPLDENEFLHQVLSRRKAAGRMKSGEHEYEQDLGAKTNLAFDSFPIVKHTLERIAWVKARIGEREQEQKGTNGVEYHAEPLNGEGWLHKLSKNSDKEELQENYDSASRYQGWKQEVLDAYLGDEKEQWKEFFQSEYSLKQELKDKKKFQENSGKFFWNSLGLGIIYLFCSLYLWGIISSFSPSHLLLALGYVFVLAIFPDRWMHQLFGKQEKQPVEQETEPSTHYAPLSKSLFWVRLLLTCGLSLALVFVSEGLPVWTEYAQYFLEYSPYWLMIWAMSFSLLHFLPAYRYKTTQLYKHTINPYKRYKSYSRSSQYEKLMKLVEQGEKWNQDMLREKEALRKSKNDEWLHGDLYKKKKLYETQLERLGYLYDLGMGSEEGAINPQKRKRKQNLIPTNTPLDS